ncbi:MAG TPA: CoB--CoM heterodisulfide reductase iron-sulfur subunit B family protein [Anaerolineales bacterium]|nr:CoB--CoM heterodisulfide reductase iron-sulfur subunit B family protein [Anaerolineales bacterium]
MSYSYYPGCSLHSTGLEYGLSTRAVFQHLQLELKELLDWNCCGASSAHIFDHTLALALPARTLALAQAFGRDLVTPCAACYNRLQGADHAMRTDPRVRSEMESLLGFQYTGAVAVRPVLAVLYEDIGVERIAAQVRHPLTGLKVVTYYGCLLVRPPEIAQFDDPDNPQVMAALLRAVGAEVMPWSHATDCCGGSLSLGRSDVVGQLVGKLASRATEAGADAIVTACPLCQVNLEMRQTTAPKVPTFYFTELLGLAFGLPEATKWWKKHLIDPGPALAKLERTAA